MESGTTPSTTIEKYRIIQDRLYQSDFDHFLMESTSEEGGEQKP